MEYPMAKRIGRNISIPYFLNLWLDDHYKGNTCSSHVVDLILADIQSRDSQFCDKFKKEIGYITSDNK